MAGVGRVSSVTTMMVDWLRVWRSAMERWSYMDSNRGVQLKIGAPKFKLDVLQSEWPLARSF